MKNKISIGIIGFGNIGKKRYQSLKKLSQIAKVKVICDKKKIQGNLKGITITSQIRKMHNFNLDLILICTPTEISKNIYRQFVGKYHLLIEKPITLNAKDLFKNIKKSNNNKKIFRAGYNLRFDNGLNYIKNLLELKVLGKIYHCKISYANGTARSNTNNVGSIFDMGSHSINLLMWLFKSKILKVIKTINQKNEFNKNLVDNGYAIIKVKNILISLHHGFCNWKNIFELEIHGSKGSLKVNSLPKWSNQIIYFERRTLPSGYPKIKIKKFKEDLSFKNELQHILKNILNINKITSRTLNEINFDSFYTLKNSIALKK